MHPKIYSFGARLDREGRWKPPSCSIGTKYAFTSLCRSRIDFSISSVVLGVGGGGVCMCGVCTEYYCGNARFGNSQKRLIRYG